jgi:protein-disulfide isomerase
MSKKNRKAPPRKDPSMSTAPAPTPAPAPAPARGAISRTSLFIAAAVALIVAFAVGAVLYKSEKDKSAQQAAANGKAQLASGHSPLLGKADAKVHIVEFLDPACETCAVFYPHVKKLMADNPGRIKLSTRHVPFHQGSEHVVRMLEAARAQDKYWETLEAVFTSQDRWTGNHQVFPERVWPALEGIGLDLERVRREMNAADIAARMERDSADAGVLGVTKTPEYFVNGRPLPRFGLEELQGLVREELRSAYR